MKCEWRLVITVMRYLWGLLNVNAMLSVLQNQILSIKLAILNLIIVHESPNCHYDPFLIRLRQGFRDRVA